MMVRFALEGNHPTSKLPSAWLTTEKKQCSVLWLIDQECNQGTKRQ